MITDSDISTLNIPDRDKTARRGARLGAKAVAIGSTLFAVWFVLEDSVNSPGSLPGQEEHELVFALRGLVLIVGPILGFLFAALPGVIGGAALALLYRTLHYSYSASKTIMILVGAFCGGLLAFLVLTLADVTSQTYDDQRKLYILGGGVLIGAGVGIWHACKINRWLMEYPTQLKSRSE